MEIFSSPYIKQHIIQQHNIIIHKLFIQSYKSNTVS